MKRPVHFEIHADDPIRAAKFYSTVFGWDIKKWDNDYGMDYWMVMTGSDDQLGIHGGLLKRQGSVPKEGNGVNAFVCTMDVPSVDDALKSITDNGGKIALPKMPIPGMGWVAYGIDTEGNTFGVMQEDKNAK